MASTFANIKPTGLTKKDLVDALYMIVSSIAGICAKLDADGPGSTFVANCCTAIFNCVIEDSKGNVARYAIAETSAIEPTHIISPGKITDAAMNALMYQIFNSLETLTEQCDTEAFTLNNYEATAYTATMTQIIENSKGNQLGNGTRFYFRPGGMLGNQKEIVEFLYNCFYSIYLLTHDGTSTGLDADGTLTDTDYNALWYTATLTLMIENSQGSQIGISR